jgi:organic radical activating enzyme
MIHIDIIEHCNFKCYFCAAKDLPESKFMDKDLFKRIIQEAAELGITEINMVPIRGEPFLHPHIYEMLDFAADYVKCIHLFTNATAINVKKLKTIRRSHLDLCISQYGYNSTEFVELTQTNERLYEIFHQRIQELTQNNIKHEIHVRTHDYDYDYDDHHARDIQPFDITRKCKYHHQPKIYVNGDITFCMFIESEVQGSKGVFYANLNTISLKDALHHPLRYKFYDSQTICSDFCQSYARNCHNAVDMSSLRSLLKAKESYLNAPAETDKAYDALYGEINDLR